MRRILIAAAVGLLLGAGAGWTANGWRLGIKLAHLEGERDTLRTANSRCKVDVDAVQKSVKGIVTAAEEQMKKGAEAMTKAAGAAKAHSDRAKEILNRPPVPLDQQCATIIREQREYVEERRKAR